MVSGEKVLLLLLRLCFPSWLSQLPYHLVPQFRTTTQSNEVCKFTNHAHKKGGRLKWSNLLSGSYSQKRTPRTRKMADFIDAKSAEHFSLREEGGRNSMT